jgi:hypothetical protein
VNALANFTAAVVTEPFAQPSLDESRSVVGVLVVALGASLSASWDELVGSLTQLDRPIEAHSCLPTQMTIIRS